MGCHGNQLENSEYPKNIKLWVMVGILVIHIQKVYHIDIPLPPRCVVLIRINMREGVAPLIWGCHKYKNRICGMTHQPHERSSQRITNERVWSTKMGYKD